MAKRWLAAGAMAGAMALGGAARAQDGTTEAAVAPELATAPTWLAWRQGPDGPQTAWLTEDPARGYRIVASAPGRFVAHAGVIWEIGGRAQPAEVYDTSCVMDDEDADFDAPPARCALPGVVVTTQARELGGDGLLTLPSVSGGSGTLCELSQSDDVVGSVGPWVFVRSCSYEYSCFAAHGAVTCEAHVLNLAAERVDGIEAMRDAGDVDGALREQAWAGASDEVQWMADDASSLSLVGVWPAWREDGRLQVRLQYAGASCYACSDGAWSSYTESVDVGTDEVPELLRAYRHLPAPVRAWLEAEGAWPGGRFGFSALR